MRPWGVLEPFCTRNRYLNSFRSNFKWIWKNRFFEFFICGFIKKWTRRIFYGSRNFEISLKMGQHTSYLSHIQNVVDNSSSFPLKPNFCGFWPKPQKGNITYDSRKKGGVTFEPLTAQNRQKSELFCKSNGILISTQFYHKPC